MAKSPINGGAKPLSDNKNIGAGKPPSDNKNIGAGKPPSDNKNIGAGKPVQQVSLPKGGSVSNPNPNFTMPSSVSP